jgi:dTDP-4-amino-4,6-dideoxygalactose transaminase
LEVKLLDLQSQYNGIRNEIEKVVKEVIESQYFILGPKVEELEGRVAEYCGCKFAVGVSSGTDALLISLMTAGIGDGDMVLTTPYTFFATAGAIARVGAVPVFVDIDDETYNMDAEKLAEAVHSLNGEDRHRLKAVIPIHLYGQCADMEPILDIAKANRAVVIEDAAQAIGAEYEFKDKAVKRAGSMGHYGCFSFFPSKNLGAFGDGGMVTTNDEEVFERLKTMRVHGSGPKYYHSMIGGNFRLDALQAAVLNVKLKYLDVWTGQRQENAGYYRKLFAEKALHNVILPMEKEKRHIYNQFIIKVDEHRDALKKHLGDKGVGSEIYYPVPLHMQECFKYLGNKPEDFPVSAEAARKTLALPIYPELSHGQIEYIVDIIGKFMKKV